MMLKPVPLLENLENYQLFLEEMRNEYYLIVEQCAPKISKHFTKLTQVINEGNSYEFPSVDIHKAVILRLILNEPDFNSLILFVQEQFTANETQIREENSEFAQAYDLFIQIFDELNKQPVNIEQYLKDLKKHAIQEYVELIEEEKETKMQKQLQNQITMTKNDESKKKKKRRKARRVSQDKELQKGTISDLQKTKLKTNENNEFLHKLDTDDLVQFINSQGQGGGKKLTNSLQKKLVGKNIDP